MQFSQDPESSLPESASKHKAFLVTGDANGVA